jgi:ABC-type glycerol-3-phosphate transport system substrate-binding protein
MNRSRLRSAVGLLLVAGVALSAAACGSDDGGNAPASDPNAKVTLVINGLPPDTEAVNRKHFLDNVAEFEKLNPNIDVDAKEGKMDPQTFQSKLAGGQLEDVFYVYFTDPASLIAKRQVADISKYLDEFAPTKQLRPDLMKIFSDDAGKVYGLPAKNYSLGLLYNRDLFTQAKLDPNNPPKTWDEVRAAAKAISALGKDYVGYGDYSKNNTGGWHFTAGMYSLGGDVAVNEGGTWKAAFNNEKGTQVLQQLKDMRWSDNSMGQRQLLEWADLLQMMGSGKLGMYMAAPDNIETIVNQFKGDFNKYGLGPIPNGTATLAGGEGYMFNAKATPEKIRAGLKWLTFWWDNPDRIETEYQWAASQKTPVGLPEPALWTGDAKAKQQAAVDKLKNLPVENYKPFADATANIPLKVEPPNAQQVYAVLDVPMQKVLTDKNADIAKLLKDAETQVNGILASVK